MPETLCAPLAAAAIETFESLAYAFAEQGSIGEIPSDGVDGVVGVTFSGPSRGGVVMQLSGGILGPLTASMLGVDETPTLAQQADALGEVVNIICGNVLPRVAGSAAVFSLGVPTSYPTWDAALAAIGSHSTLVRLDLEGGRADIAFVNKDEVP
jgi:CheY-specific phosphatase CheX